MQRYKTTMNILLFFLLSILAAVGVLLTPELSEYGGKKWLLDLVVSRCLSCFIYLELFGLLLFVWKKKIRKVSCAAVIPAILFSAISVAEGSLNDSVTLYCPSWKAIALAFIGCLAMYVFLLELIYWGIDIILSFAPDRIAHNKRIDRNLNKRLEMFGYSVLIILLWSPWMLMCFPGNMNSDTGSSILYHLGLDRSNINNPFFQNFVFGMVYRLGRILGDFNISAFLYVLCQSTLLAVTLGISLSHLKRWGAPRFWIIALISLYGFCPYFPIFSITLGKDSNFTVVAFAFTVLLTLYISQEKEFVDDWKKVSVISGMTILMGLLRNHGALIGITCLTVCGIRYGWQTKKIPKLLGIALAVILMITSVLPSAMGVPKTMTRESMSIPLQQTARYAIKHGAQVTQEEREVIDAVIPYDMLFEYYAVLADPVKSHVRETVTKENWQSYFRVWLKQMCLQPKTYLEAFYFQTYGYYSLKAIADAKPMRRWGYHVSDEFCEMLNIKTIHDPLKLQLAKSIDEWVMKVPVLGLFQRIGIYTWILIVCIAYLISRKKSWTIVCLLPSIIILAGCCFSPVNGYPRYALSAAVMIPVMASCAFFLSNSKKQ